MSTLIERLREALARTYEIDREIGRGGMAVVFKASDLKQNRSVAIKVLKPELAAFLGADRFLREIHIASSLQHPNLLPVFESGESNGLLYYTMPLIEGETLEDRLEREGALPIEDAARITAEILDALGYAHSHGFVHRDIKPGNIMLSWDHVLVADFGVARAVDAAGSEDITESGLAVGTPSYMSPEQASADKRLDGRSDIYSVGCLLYEMLVGEPPFTGPTASAVLARQVAEEPRSIRIVRPTVSTGLEWVIEKALAKEPADRFQTASRMKEALEKPKVSRPSIRAAVWSPRFRFATLSLVVGAVMVGVALITREVRGPLTSGDKPLDPRRIAVLPFDYPEGDRELGEVAVGMTRDLIDALSSVGELTLISEPGVREFTSSTPVDSIVRLRRVGTVVQASLVRVPPDSVRVDVRLIDGSSAVQFAAIRDVRKHSADLALRDAVVSKVADKLRNRLGTRIVLQEMHAGATNDSAWRLRQRAFELQENRDSVSDATALELLGRVISLDPHWVEPYVAAGWTAMELGSFWPESNGAEELDRAMAYSESALALQADYAPALELRGHVRHMMWRRMPGFQNEETLRAAAADLTNATLLNPELARAWNELSSVRQRLGDQQGAVEAARRAIEADAYLRDIVPSVQRLIFAYLRDEQPDSARALCYEGSERFPTSGVMQYCKLSVLAWVGSGPTDIDTVWAALRRAEENSVTPLLEGKYDPQARLSVAAVLARSGLLDSARSMTNDLRERLVRAGSADSYLVTEAHVRTLLGEHDQAIELLRRSISASPGIASFIASSPWFAPLRERADFRGLLLKTSDGSGAP